MKAEQKNFGVIPQPVRIFTEHGATCFTLTNNVRLINESGFEDVFEFFQNSLILAFDIEPRSFGEEAVLLKFNENIENSEGYHLTVTDNLVTIYASAAAGFFYGLQTLMQLLLQGNRELCRTEIEDYPRFTERGFMLDVSRRFCPADQIKKLIDAMALHKLNRLHLHMTDDQGWRIEIRRYPLLALIGSHRSSTGFGVKSHEGFYTQQEMREIIEYAHKRFVRIVPEIDLPAHCTAAVAAYPALSCTGAPTEVSTHFGTMHNGLCAGQNFTYGFCFNVLDEIASLFPDGEIHIGGNDTNSLNWDNCPRCRQAVADKGLAEENGLTEYFVDRLRAYFSGSDIVLTAWDNPCIKSQNIDYPNLIRQRRDLLSLNQLEDALKFGKVIVSTDPTFSVGLPYNALSLESCYNYEIVPETIGSKLSANLIGVEAMLWTDDVPSLSEALMRVFPRLAAICENAWSSTLDKDFSRFIGKVTQFLCLLDLYSVPHADTDELKKHKNENDNLRRFRKKQERMRKLGF